MHNQDTPHPSSISLPACPQLVAVGSRTHLMQELRGSAERRLHPPVEGHGAATGADGSHHVGVHPGPIPVYHEVRVYEGVRRLPPPCPRCNGTQWGPV